METCPLQLENALLIMEAITNLVHNQDDDNSSIAKECEEIGAAAQRDVILSHAAPALSKALVNDLELVNCSFDVEIIESVIDYIDDSEDGLRSSQPVWNEAYIYAYYLNEKGLSEADAISMAKGGVL